jgi:glyoxylase-like metal-dependent hydrolase (beta-lactamase superfamily II)
MMPGRLVFLGLGFLLLVSGVAHSQDRFDGVQITATHVAGNIYILEGFGGNIGASVGEDGVLIVDDQYTPLAEKIRAALAGVGGGELAFVLNTHWHGDHTSGNDAFGPEAPIIAHRNVRERLSRAQALPRRTYEARSKEALPVITFNDSLWLHFNGEDIRAIHFPHGHTDGDIVIFFPESNVVHTGDMFWNSLFPFIDLETGGQVHRAIEHVETLMEMIPRDAMIIPGHGDLSTYEDLESYHQMLTETTDFVRQGMAEGKSLDDLKAAGLPEKWADWSWSFIPTETWIETIYKNYTAGSEGE